MQIDQFAGFAQNYAVRVSETVRKDFSPSGVGTEVSTGASEKLSYEPILAAGMDPFGDDDIAQLLRLKRYEEPSPDYFENFLHEFRRRQRDELLRQPVWRICFERAHGFALRHNVRPYPVGVVAVVACAAVVSIRVYQQPKPAQVAVESSPVPRTPPANAEREFNLAPLAVPRTFNAEPILLPRSRDIPLLSADLFRSDQFVPLKLEWESLDDHSLPANLKGR